MTIVAFPNTNPQNQHEDENRGCVPCVSTSYHHHRVVSVLIHCSAKNVNLSLRIGEGNVEEESYVKEPGTL